MWEDERNSFDGLIERQRKRSFGGAAFSTRQTEGASKFQRAAQRACAKEFLLWRTAWDFSDRFMSESFLLSFDFVRMIYNLAVLSLTMVVLGGGVFFSIKIAPPRARLI